MSWLVKELRKKGTCQWEGLKAVERGSNLVIAFSTEKLQSELIRKEYLLR